jgi:hypothetical protein
MTSRPAWWQASLSFLSQPGPDDVTRRPCGCRIDPVVFGHYCTAPAGAS